MNFLAHSLLSPTFDHWMTGNLVADLIKKKEIVLLSSDIQKGVFLHYEIDSYTDSHSVVGKATHLLHPTQGKYSPVATDLIWDLCLAKTWNLYSDVPLHLFIKNVYSHLMSELDQFEPRLTRSVTSMIEKDFLTMYTTPESMKLICEKIHQRTRFKSNLHLLMDDYSRLESDFDRLFQHFYPDLNVRIDEWKSKITSKSSNADF